MITRRAALAAPLLGLKSAHNESIHARWDRVMRKLGRTKYDGAVMAVAHNQFKELGVRGVRKLLKPKSVIYDIKHVFKRGQTDGRL